MSSLPIPPSKKSRLFSCFVLSKNTIKTTFTEHKLWWFKMMRAVAFRLALGPSASNGACCSFTILNRGKVWRYLLQVPAPLILLQRLFCSADEVDSIKAEKVDDGYKFKFTTPYEAHRLPATPRNEAVTTRVLSFFSFSSP